VIALTEDVDRRPDPPFSQTAEGQFRRNTHDKLSHFRHHGKRLRIGPACNALRNQGGELTAWRALLLKALEHGTVKPLPVFEGWRREADSYVELAAN